MVKHMNNGVSGFQQFVANRQSDAKKKPGSIWIWILIFVLAWWLASSWLLPKPVTPTADKIVVTEDLSRVPVQTLQSGQSLAKIQGLRISDISLLNYNAEHADTSGPMRLLAADKEFVEIGLLASGTTAPSADTVWHSETQNDTSLRKVWKNADGIEFMREINFEDYIISIKDTVKNTSNRDVSFVPYARVVSSEQENSQAIVASGAIAFINGQIERETWNRLEKKSFVHETTSGFVGFESQYWETIVSLGANDQTIRMKHIDGARFQVDTSANSVQVGAGKTAEITTRIYAGPKTQEQLTAAAMVIPGANQTIDYGWLWFLAQPFLWTLNWLFAFVGNYGIAIILLTIGLRILMWPLTKKSYTSMAAMQQMQPELQRVQKLYANDKPRLQAEMMRIYKSNKTSPVSGCLPMLLQIPIFFALYKALLISVPMRHSGFLWINDLAAADPTSIFNLFGLLPFGVPSWLMIGALPIIMGITMWVQQKLQTGATANLPADKNNPMAQSMKIMKWMPIFFVVLFAWMPAGLVLYWTASNLFGIGQMWAIKRMESKKK